MKINRLTVLLLILVLIPNLVLNAQKKHKTTKLKQPNFLFVLVDDQPFDAVGYSGRYPFLKTPNIDRLSNEGANFDFFLLLNLFVLHQELAF